EQLGQIFSKISIVHLNVLLLLGLALFGGTVGGRIFERLKIPQVVGYIMIGVLIGQTGLKLVDKETILKLQPFNYFALGLIGFMVGGELKREMFKKYGKQFIYILFCEGITPFLIVTFLVAVFSVFLFQNWIFAWALAILMGAIASATDPTSTINVINEYKTKGPLTTTIIGIVALDDGLALFLFVIASSIAGKLIGNGSQGSSISAFIQPFYEIAGAVGLGILSGYVFIRVIRCYAEASRILVFAIGMVLFVSGLSIAAHLDMLLATMTFGIIVANFTPRKSKEVFNLVEGFTPPIYVLFFVLVGANLNLMRLNFPVLVIVFVYIFGTMLGKIFGSRIGARISGAPESVKRYLSFCLFPQAGIAIGLSILAAQYFPGEIGNTLVVVITTTTFIMQIVGPSFTKYGLKKAGEINLNITEQDIITRSLIEDVMDKTPPLIYEDMTLSDILELFSKSNNFYYPVVGRNKKLCGIISLDSIRQILVTSDLAGILLAHDLMEEVIASVGPSVSISEAKDIFDRYTLDYLPVLDDAGELAGFIEKRSLNRFISTRIIQLQKQAESLG
ncbi:MAG TPA: CBS domain-containing protein, partial [Candidatus Omnitrophica bacterium]|nr:CBS domain-containing protein [Candidatus Omnitrophota bacterium]